jgi:hypothetical protein
MQTIYEKNPGELIATLPRTVTHYDSGLIQVSQTFVGRTDLSSQFRSILEVGDVFPTNTGIRSVDLIRIFPNVSENVRTDGMTEFIVNGYGRANTIGISRYEYNTTTFSQSVPELVVDGVVISPAYTRTGVYRLKTKIVKRVLSASEQYNFNADISSDDDFQPVLVQGYRAIKGRWAPAVVGYQSQPYGQFQEITVSISAVQVFEF